MQGKEGMDKRKAEKAAAVVIAMIVTVLSLFRVADWQSVGIYDRCLLQGRLLYPFFHASVFHAILNAWCLLALVFTYDITYRRMTAAYIAAVSVPVATLGTFLPLARPTVGLSGVVYFLFGSISFEVARKGYYQSWMLSYIAAGFVFPGTNAWLHLYCYLCGIALALLNKPINRER